MDISIIIPVLNEAERIACAVRRACETNAAEVIVVDGGSVDGTAALAKSAGANVIESSPGRSKQQNAGARQARGDVLLFLHADCWLAPGALVQIDEALAEAQIQCGAFRQRIEAEGRRYRWLEQGNAWRVRRRGLPYGDQGIFVRRATFEAQGGFPEVRFLEDVMLMRQLRGQAWPALLPGPIYVSPRRWQKHGVVRQTVRNWLLLAAFRLGVHPDRLAAFYAPHQNPAHPTTTAAR